MRVWYLNLNCGDGSSITQFFNTEPDLDALIEQDDEGYAMNEEVRYFDINLDGTTTIRFTTVKEILE